MFKKLKNTIEKFILKISKRRRFIFSSGLLSLGLLSVTFNSYSNILLTLPVIAVITYLFAYFAILEGITRKEKIMLFIVPLYFTIVFTLAYYFFPQRWITRFPYIIIYGISIYAILLSQNIFNVGALKSLALFRAAFSVNYLFITIASFIAYNIILSFRSHFIVNAFAIFLVTLPIALQFIWSIDPKDTVDRSIINYAFFIAVILFEITLIFSFIPINASVFGLLLTSVLYSLLGIFQAHIQQTLYRQRIREYLFVLLFMAVLTVMSLNW